MRWSLWSTVALLPLMVCACARSAEDTLEEVRELQQEGRIEESIPLLVDLIEGGNRDGEVLYQYGRALSLTGKPERSVWALDAARDDPDWFVFASKQLAMDAFRGNNLEFALEIFERLHEERPEEIDQDLTALELEARVLIETRTKFEEALELIESILERFPESENGIRLKAVALLGLKRPEEAYELMHAAGIHPSKADEEGDSDQDSAESTEAAASAKTEEEGGEGDDAGLYLEVEDEAQEAYWCTVRATFNREAGKLDEASKVVDECLERFPGHVDLISEAVELYSKTGRFDRILGILEKANEASPETPDIRRALVQHLESIGRHEDAEKILRKAVDAAVADGPGGALQAASNWVDLAGFMMERDRIPEALECFDAAFAILGEAASPDLLLRWAEALIRSERFDEALAVAERTTVEVHGQMLRGRIAYERGDYQTALKELGQAALIWPNNAPIRYYRARAAEGVGDFDLAVEDYRQAVRSDPRLSAAREQLAKLHLAEGRVREAAMILNFESPKQRSQPSAAMRILMVEVQTRSGLDPDMNIAPDVEYPVDRVRREAVRSLVRGLRARLDAKPAADLLASIETGIVPREKGKFVRERIKLLTEVGEADAAVSAARDALKSQPTDSDMRIALGYALASQRANIDEAETLLSEALESAPGDPDALVGLGKVAAARGDSNAAIANFERALETAPDDWQALSLLIESMDASGKRDEATARLERYLAKDSPYDAHAALELARRLEANPKARETRVELALRAIRFRGGKDAVTLLESLDPAAAAAYMPKSPNKGDERKSESKKTVSGTGSPPKETPGV